MTQHSCPHLIIDGVEGFREADGRVQVSDGPARMSRGDLRAPRASPRACERPPPPCAVQTRVTGRVEQPREKRVLIICYVYTATATRAHERDARLGHTEPTGGPLATRRQRRHRRERIAVHRTCRLARLGFPRSRGRTLRSFAQACGSTRGTGMVLWTTLILRPPPRLALCQRRDEGRRRRPRYRPPTGRASICHVVAACWRCRGRGGR